MNTTDLVSLIQSGGDITRVLEQEYAQRSSVLGANKANSVPLMLYKTHVTTYNNGIEKAISISDFKNILDEVTKTTSENISPICLPFGCFMFNRVADNMYLNCYYPETIVEIKYDSREGESKKIETFKIPLPNIIISFWLKKVSGGMWGTQRVNYYSTSKTVTQLPDKAIIVATDPEKGIFKLPLSNVYEENTLCYGNNTMPSRFTDNLRGLDYYYQILTIAPFNSDLGIRGLTTDYTPKNWYKHLSTLKQFPYDLLSSSIRR